MSANLVEKGFALFAIGTSVLFMGRSYFSAPKTQKHNAFKIRQQLLNNSNAKMLYSTMSFFYLIGFQQSSLDSFYTLHKVMSIQTPNLVALPISKEDYDKRYGRAMQHPKFREAMDKFVYMLDNQDSEGIRKMEEFDLKNLQKLYLIDKCHKLKKCKVICGRRSTGQYKQIQKIYEDMKKGKNIEQIPKPTNSQQASSLSISDMKIEDYSQSIITEMNPKLKVSLLPESPYKIVIGIVEPQLLQGTAQRWKQKFKKNYSHNVIEDEEVIEREKAMQQSKSRVV